MFLHVIDLSPETMRDPVDDFHALNAELERYDSTLCQRRQIVAANKIDVLDDQERLNRLQRFCEQEGVACFPISAVTGQGVSAVIQHLTKLLYPEER
jgi:GTP-binding protein